MGADGGCFHLRFADRLAPHWINEYEIMVFSRAVYWGCGCAGNIQCTVMCCAVFLVVFWFRLRLSRPAEKKKNWFKVAKCDKLHTVFFVESIRMYGGLSLKATSSELGTLV